MDLVVGTICDGKVSGIMKFGAFITLPSGKSGLVHISEIANSYVNEIKDHLAEGQDVKVKIIGIDETGRINLSIKKAVENAPAQAYANSGARPPQFASRRPASRPFFQKDNYKSVPSGDSSFEDKLKQFMQDSDNKMSGLKKFSDKKGSSRRGRH